MHKWLLIYKIYDISLPMQSCQPWKISSVRKAISIALQLFSVLIKVTFVLNEEALSITSSCGDILTTVKHPSESGVNYRRSYYLLLPVEDSK